MSSSIASSSVVKSLYARAEESVAARQFSRAEVLLRSADALCMTVESAIRLGEALAAWGRTVAAEEILTVAWERAKKSNSPKAVRDACLALTRFYRDQDDLLRARQFEQLAIRSSLLADEKGQIDGSTLLSVAVGQILDGDSDATADALLASASSRDDFLEATVESVRAISSMLADAGDDCGERLYRSYRTHKQQGSRLESATDLFFVGHVLRASGRYADAAVCYTGAAEVWESLGHLNDARDAACLGRQCRQIVLAAETTAGVN